MKHFRIFTAGLLGAALVLPSCSSRTNVYDESFKNSYKDVVVKLIQRRYDQVIPQADSCLSLIRPDTSIYYIGLQNAIGMAAMELGDTVRSRAGFEAALEQIERKMELMDTVDYRTVINRAHTLCFLGRKEEALQYIGSIQFPKQELTRFRGKSPVDFFRDFNHGPRHLPPMPVPAKSLGDPGKGGAPQRPEIQQFKPFVPKQKINN